MIKRDILVDEVEQLGKVLAMIIAKFFADKSKYEDLQKLFSETNNLLQDEDLNINVTGMLTLENKDFVAYLDKLNIPIVEIDSLGDYLLEMGIYEIDQQSGKGEAILEKCLLLYDFVTLKTKTMSLERIDKENKIKFLLDL